MKFNGRTILIMAPLLFVPAFVAFMLGAWSQQPLTRENTVVVDGDGFPANGRSGPMMIDPAYGGSVNGRLDRIETEIIRLHSMRTNDQRFYLWKFDELGNMETSRKWISLPTGECIRADVITAIRIGDASDAKWNEHYGTQLLPRVIVDIGQGNAPRNSVIIDCKTVEERDALAARIRKELEASSE